MTNRLTQWLDENKDVGLLVLRLYLGLRLVSGALRRFIETERLDAFSALAGDLGAPAPGVVAVVVFLVQLVGGLLLILGWKTRAAALALAMVLIFCLLLLHRNDHLHPGMPPLAALAMCMIFIFIPPGRFSFPIRLNKV
jgi:putative oxidoreductase